VEKGLHRSPLGTTRALPGDRARINQREDGVDSGPNPARRNAPFQKQREEKARGLKEQREREDRKRDREKAQDQEERK
jgi:hypothetical protein